MLIRSLPFRQTAENRSWPLIYPAFQRVSMSFSELPKKAVKVRNAAHGCIFFFPVLSEAGA